MIRYIGIFCFVIIKLLTNSDTANAQNIEYFDTIGFKKEKIAYKWTYRKKGEFYYPDKTGQRKQISINIDYDETISAYCNGVKIHTETSSYCDTCCYEQYIVFSTDTIPAQGLFGNKYIVTIYAHSTKQYYSFRIKKRYRFISCSFYKGSKKLEVVVFSNNVPFEC